MFKKYLNVYTFVVVMTLVNLLFAYRNSVLELTYVVLRNFSLFHIDNLISAVLYIITSVLFFEMFYRIRKGHLVNKIMLVFCILFSVEGLSRIIKLTELYSAEKTLNYISIIILAIIVSIIATKKAILENMPNINEVLRDKDKLETEMALLKARTSKGKRSTDLKSPVEENILETVNKVSVFLASDK